MFVALVIQHTVAIAPYILSSVACLSLRHFSTPAHKFTRFLKKITNIKGAL
jgi:hypothetical protein